MKVFSPTCILQIFFKPNFDLSDPETFTAVLGCAEEVKEVKEKFSPIRERHPKKISVNTNEHLSREVCRRAML